MPDYEETYIYEGKTLNARLMEPPPRLVPVAIQKTAPQDQQEPAEELPSAVRLLRSHHEGMLRVHEDYLKTLQETHDAYISVLNSATLLPGHVGQPSRDFSTVIPECRSLKSSFSVEEVLHFRRGEMAACFGEHFRWLSTHTRTPRRESTFECLGRILDFDPSGCRLRAVGPAPPHEKVTEAFLDAMAFYMTGLGFTMYCDGWLFEAVVGSLPSGEGRYSRTGTVQYEIFVDEITVKPFPTIHARAVCSADGTDLYTCERIGLRLVPDWPLTTLQNLYREDAPASPAAAYKGFHFDYAAMLNCSLGKPSLAFGDRFAVCDTGKRSPRLPGPPFLFVSRISELNAIAGSTGNGPSLTAEYDIPRDAWYFTEGGNGSMPYCVLMEAAMQPCGWLGVFTMSDDQLVREYVFRALDGTAVQFREITPRDRSIRSKIKLLSVANTGEMIVEKFDVHCFCGDEEVFSMQGVFGFCSPGLMEDKKGFPASATEREQVKRQGSFNLDLSTLPSRYYLETSARMPSLRLRMLDRVTEYLPRGGKAGKGYLRGEKDIAVEDWFFKAHFMQDPVQPGSLGVEAVLQLMKFYLLHNDRHRTMQNPRFESVLMNGETEWHYRGQVTPAQKRIVVDLDIVDEGTASVSAEARLWVDDMKVYHIPRIGMRVYDDTRESTTLDWSFSLEENPWVEDHKPTYTLPVLPLMYEIDMMASATELFPGKKLTLVDKMEAKRWMSIENKILCGRTIAVRDGNCAHVELQALLQGTGVYETCASGDLFYGDSYPPAETADIPPLIEGARAGCPYLENKLFHGPSFRLMSDWTMGSNGSRGRLDARSRGVPYGLTHPGLMDAALHCLPIYEMWRWDPAISRDNGIFPLRLKNVRFYSDLPHEGIVDVEMRYVGLDHGYFPTGNCWMFDNGSLIASFTWVGVQVPIAMVGGRDPESRVAFLESKCFVPGALLSQFEGGETILHIEDLTKSDWLPGTIASVYGFDGSLPISRAAAIISVKEHIGRQIFQHPAKIQATRQGVCANTPINNLSLAVREQEERVAVRGDIGEVCLDGYDSGHSELNKMKMGVFFEDMEKALIAKFVRRFVLEDPDGFNALKGKPAVYLANHQTGIESLLFSCLLRWQGEAPINTIAKIEHKKSWLGNIDAYCKDIFGDAAPMAILYFDRRNPASIFKILRSFSSAPQGIARSLLVHVEGTRALNANHTVTKISSVALDLAIDAGLPVVPVRFAGGLPVEGNMKRLEFPVRYGRQDIYLGSLISAGRLKGLNLSERTKIVADAINSLGPLPGDEKPLPGEKGFAALIEELQNKHALSEIKAVIAGCLLRYRDAKPETGEFLDNLFSNRIDTSAMSKNSLYYRAVRFIREA